MKLTSIMKLGVIALAVSTLATCGKVPYGNVGVKVNKMGSESGVSEKVVDVGYEFMPPTQELFIFPTFTQNEIWTQSAEEGSKRDESVTFQTAEGLVVGADIGLTYRVDRDRVVTLFQKYRTGIDEITDVYLRNMIRDALVEASSSLAIESVYGQGKVEMMNTVEESVRSQVVEYGIIIEKIYWIGDLRLPKTVTDSINNKIEATQKAQKRENEVATAIAQAQIEREKAQGEADALLINAKARADALDAEGAAIARNPQVLQLRGVESWNGVLPIYMGGNAPVPFVQVDRK